MNFILFLVTFLLSVSLTYSYNRGNENERVAHFFETKTWPPSVVKHSESFDNVMKKRERDIMMLPGSRERWENFMQYTQGLITKRITPQGFKVRQIPDEVFTFLKKKLDEGLEKFDQLPDESFINVVYTPIPSKMINLSTKDVRWILEQLQPIHEEWSGLKLKPTTAYGIRLYRDGASLGMHYDRCNTHVISAIVHIGHEYTNDEEPWPIEIEDHDGNIHAVNLKAGEMLFYESASCLHGRRKIFHGKHYSSIFVHYNVVDSNDFSCSIGDIIDSVPPFWSDNVVEEVGSRWSGQSITTDELATEGVPKRVINGVEYNSLEEFWSQRGGLPEYSLESYRHSEL